MKIVTKFAYNEARTEYPAAGIRFRMQAEIRRKKRFRAAFCNEFNLKRIS